MHIYKLSVMSQEDFQSWAIFTAQCILDKETLTDLQACMQAAT